MSETMKMKRYIEFSDRIWDSIEMELYDNFLDEFGVNLCYDVYSLDEWLTDNEYSKEDAKAFYTDLFLELEAYDDNYHTESSLAGQMLKEKLEEMVSHFEDYFVHLWNYDKEKLKEFREICIMHKKMDV